MSNFCKYALNVLLSFYDMFPCVILILSLALFDYYLQLNFKQYIILIN